jgi:type II secretory pathway pseudopilin PulG
MVVAVIVAILAAVAIPLMSANKTRAMMTEAESALGTVRSALRTLFAETDAYNVNLSGGAIAAGSSPTALPGIRLNDLDGRWFNTAAYSITAITASNYTLTATGSLSTTPDAADVAGVIVTLDVAGDFTRVIP